VKGIIAATRAPGKVNLCLFLGPLRDDGKHELVSVVQSVSLADAVAMGGARDDTGPDEIVCPGVEGPNLALAALTAFRRETGWDAPAQRVTIEKRVPVAAGMGGGSADAAAVLRMAARASGLGSADLLHRIAAELGADVPAALTPGCALVTGAGEHVRRLEPPAVELAVLVLPADGHLSTAAVFAEADRLGLPRSAEELGERLAAVAAAVVEGHGLTPDLMVNDLEAAARSLYPAIDEALGEATAAGADIALVSGSGPTVIGLFMGSGARERAAVAAASLDRRRPAVVVATPVDWESS
jgi:4-diphosphocytidyl-2-C-methyl-D-erythritol kinase